MVAMLDFAVFGGALAASLGVIAAMIVPQWHRIAQLAAGHVEPGFAPLATLAIAERRIAHRGMSRIGGQPVSRWREAA